MFPLAVPVEDRVVVARRPYITPLQDIVNEYARYGVVLVDKEGARLFLFNLGELQEAEGTLGSELKRHKKGGRAAARLQRRADEIANQNFREVAEMTRQFCEANRCGRLILAGTDDNVAIFRSMLPKAMQEKIAGHIPMDMYAGEVEVRDKTMELIRGHTRREEEALVERMITAATKGEAGAIGLEDTLNALQEEKVHILLVGDAYEAPGARCTHCGLLAGDATETCRYCRSPMQSSDDVVEEAVRLAIEKRVAVKVIAGNPRLQKAGNIGAILRY